MMTRGQGRGGHRGGPNSGGRTARTTDNGNGRGGRGGGRGGRDPGGRATVFATNAVATSTAAATTGHGGHQSTTDASANGRGGRGGGRRGGRNPRGQTGCATATSGHNRGPKPTPPAWGKSEAKELLDALLRDEESELFIAFGNPFTLERADIVKIHRAYDLFEQYKEQNFVNNFRTLRDSIEKEKDSIDFDQHAFDREKQKWPRGKTLANGKPRWGGSDVQKLLRKDVEDPRRKNLQPREYYALRAEYRQWSLKEFRPKVYQERRWAKFGVYWVERRNRKGRRAAAEGGVEAVDREMLANDSQV